MSKHLTIAELAEATGVSPAALRAWESRHGFPRPERLPGGRRRYTDEDVDAVLAVRAERDGGARLSAAIARVRAATREPAVSLFAELRRAPSPTAAQLVSKPTMLAMSRALEDECAAGAERGILVGAFQERRFFDASRQRWQVLARGARLAVAFADFASPAVDAHPARVPIAARTPLEREWVIAHLALRTSALVVGRERPEPPLPDGERRFEVYMSTDSALVRELVQVAARLADATAPAVADRLRRELDLTPAAGALDARFASSLTTRMVGYLDGAASR